MGKISRRHLDRELENYIFKLFWQSVADLKTSEAVEIFFKDLLSPIERLMLVKRLAIAVLLTKGYTYNQIDNTLKVSRPTIMSVSLWLKSGGTGYQKTVEKILVNQKKEKLLDFFEETILKLSLPAALGSPRFQKKRELGKKLFQRKRLRSQF